MAHGGAVQVGRSVDPPLLFSAAMFEELLADLDAGGVRFVVVGGLAVVIHGVARLTADIDLVIALDSPNVLRCLEVLTARGLRPVLPVAATDFADEHTRRRWIETRNMPVFTMRDERNPLLVVDLFATEPFPFDELWSEAMKVLLGGRTIHVASLHHLVAMKKVASRPQDLLDIEHLERIARQRGV